MSDELAAKRIERTSLKELEQSVTVSFQTMADLLADELTDEDWINLGKFVAEIAAEKRKWNERS